MTAVADKVDLRPITIAHDERAAAIQVKRSVFDSSIIELPAPALLRLAWIHPIQLALRDPHHHFPQADRLDDPKSAAGLLQIRLKPLPHPIAVEFPT